MTMPQTTQVVTVPDEWDLRAELGPVYGAEYSWKSLAEHVLPANAQIVNDMATQVVGCSWQGGAADSYMMHWLRLWPDMLDGAEIARRVSEHLRDAATVLRSAQEQLDGSWLWLRRRLDAVQLTNEVQVPLRNPADQAYLNRALQAAREIRGHADAELARIAERIEAELTRAYQLVDTWTELTDPGTTEWAGSAALGETSIVRVGNQVFVTRGVSSPGDPYNVIRDEVTVSVDPRTGEQIVSVNGVEQQRFGREVNVVLRDGSNSDGFTVGSYSPSPGIHVDRTGDSVRVTARLELYGQDASPERAKEIEDKIRAAWNGRFGDGTTIATDVQVTYRQPGTPASPDATQIEMAPTTRPSHVTLSTGEMTLNTNEPNATNAAPHEFGHQIGLRDRYQESLLSELKGMVGGQRETHHEPGYQGNIMSDLGPVQGKNVRDLADENIPTVFSDDDQVRDWVSRSDPAEVATVATATKVRMVDSLMDGWISNDDVTAIESICRTARAGDQAEAVRAAVSARLGEMWGSEQRTRLQAAIDGMR
jgi:uncharacterized protein YukE